MPPGPVQAKYAEYRPHLSMEQEVSNETEALRRYGLNIERGHMGGYDWEPHRAHHRTIKAPELWEQDIVEQMGPSKPLQSFSVEQWNNEEFLLEVREGIAYCTLNRPAANNAINGGIGFGLHDAALILRGRPDIRIVVLTGTGRMFCAGGDPKSFQQAQIDAGVAGGQQRAQETSPDEEPDFENPTSTDISGHAGLMMRKQGLEESTTGIARYIMEWASLPQFTICCMNGSAMGLGVGLACACDTVVAVRTAHITLSEVKLGVIPAAISPLILRTVGPTNARRLLCTCENCGVQTAKQMGLIQRTVPEVAEFPTVIKEIASRIQALAPGAVASTKRALFASLSKPVSEPLVESLATEYARVRKTSECEEGIRALTSKKRPAWTEQLIAVKE